MSDVSFMQKTINKRRTQRAVIATALLASSLLSTQAYAASCCGGGNASSLMLPKSGHKMVNLSQDSEIYNGQWNQDGEYVKDPKGTDLKQYRLNMGYAQRLANRWQASIILPYVWNDNEYSGESKQTSGLGDTSISAWYETFDEVTCVYQVNELADLKPAIYFGTTLTVPTGQSAYGDDVDGSFEITGRGLYRLDANMIVEKTVYPYTVMLQSSYGKHLERDVNQEYGKAVKPYKKQLGDRRFLSLSAGYTFFLEDLDTFTVTTAFADLREGKGKFNGNTDGSTEFKKQSASLSAAYASADLRYVFKASWSHALRGDDYGKNFSTTDIFTLGASYAFE